ncbi:MAG: hypothetical protein OXQ29_22725 [Rhodospirillaceae bacterium]|nr:hypothetical protein [Rhodospirillaceae bacterium]
MTALTVIQAARAGYAGRATIYRKLEAGELNSETDENGTIVIDPSELVRIFGEPAAHGGPSRETSRHRSETERLRAENTLLRAENEDLRRHRDRLMTLLEQASLPEPAPRSGRTLRGLLGRRSATPGQQ